MCLQFVFIIFGEKDFGAKAAHKMLVKLTPSLVGSGCGLTLKLEREKKDPEFASQPKQSIRFARKCLPLSNALAY